MVVDAAEKRQGQSPATAGDYRRRYTGECYSCVPSSSFSPFFGFFGNSDGAALVCRLTKS